MQASENRTAECKALTVQGETRKLNLFLMLHEDQDNTTASKNPEPPRLSWIKVS